MAQRPSPPELLGSLLERSWIEQRSDKAAEDHVAAIVYRKGASSHGVSQVPGSAS